MARKAVARPSGAPLLLAPLVLHVDHPGLLVHLAEATGRLSLDVEDWPRGAPLLLAPLVLHVHHPGLLVHLAEATPRLPLDVKGRLRGAPLLLAATRHPVPHKLFRRARDEVHAPRSLQKIFFFTRALHSRVKASHAYGGMATFRWGGPSRRPRSCLRRASRRNVEYVIVPVSQRQARVPPCGRVLRHDVDAGVRLLSDVHELVEQLAVRRRPVRARKGRVEHLDETGRIDGGRDAQEVGVKGGRPQAAKVIGIRVRNKMFRNVKHAPRYIRQD